MKADWQVLQKGTLINTEKKENMLYRDGRKPWSTKKVKNMKNGADSPEPTGETAIREQRGDHMVIWHW